jgi:catechol O-methyltransferase
MNICDVKGQYLINTIKNNNCTKILELRTYCGYSALLQIYAMGDFVSVVTVDPNQYTIDIARQIWEFAGVSDNISPVTGTIDTLLQNDVTPDFFECLFLYHFKKNYLADLINIEKHKLIKSGGVLITDNVLVFNIKDYMDYINMSPVYHQQHVVESYLEYTSESQIQIEGFHIAVKK